MGDRVSQTGQGDLARARRLKKALESGSAPKFVAPDNGSGAAQDSCSENSCPVPPLTNPAVSGPAVSEPAFSQPAFSEAKWKNQARGEKRLQFLEQMFQASPDGLSIADGEHRVLWANETFSRMFGYEAAEVAGQPLENLVVPPDRLAESRWVTESVSTGQRITLETQRRKKDGSLLDVSVSCAPLILDGKVAGFYAGYHDISDRRRVEALSSALYRVAEKSSSAHDLHQFFAAVHSIVGELMYARNFYIALYDPSTELLSFPYFVDERDAAPSPKKLGRGLTDFLLRSGEPLLATPEVLQAMEDRGEVARNGSRSLDWMGVPLKVNNHTFGALEVQT